MISSQGIVPKKVYKIIKRTRSEDKLSREEECKQDNTDVVLVKVKRLAGMRDDIEELQLEFGKGGTVKRQKLVTQNEVLVRTFNESMQITKQKETKIGFNIGVSGKAVASSTVIRLRRLMGKDEIEAKLEAQIRLIDKTRKDKRDKHIKQKRNLDSIDTHGESQTSENLEPTSSKDFKVISLVTNEEECEDQGYLYFLAKKQGNYLVDPFTQVQDLYINDSGSSNDPYEKDSQDSNRESAEQNDYPDEEMVDSDGRSRSSSIDSQKLKRPIKKHATGCQKWLDTVLRKNKNGVTLAKTINQQLESNINDVGSDDYGLEAAHSRDSIDEF